MSVEKEKPREYEPPKVVTFSQSDLLEEVGPTQAVICLSGFAPEPG